MNSNLVSLYNVNMCSGGTSASSNESGLTGNCDDLYDAFMSIVVHMHIFVSVERRIAPSAFANSSSTPIQPILS
jgi:hypothetical protein